MKSNQLVLLASIFGGLSILIGAFGAHALPNWLQALDAEEVAKRVEWLQTGVQYHLLHSVALLSLAAIRRDGNGYSRWAGPLWIAGIVGFSGTLYVMSLTGIRPLGAVVPLGGLAYVCGWFTLAISAFGKH